MFWIRNGGHAMLVRLLEKVEYQDNALDQTDVDPNGLTK